MGCNHVRRSASLSSRGLTGRTDDLLQVQAALLLPVRVEAAGGQPVRALLATRRRMLRQAV
jgi:hypothetical protein